VPLCGPFREVSGKYSMCGGKYPDPHVDAGRRVSRDKTSITMRDYLVEARIVRYIKIMSDKYIIYSTMKNAGLGYPIRT
jgi:hypothetical protein